MKRIAVDLAKSAYQVAESVQVGRWIGAGGSIPGHLRDMYRSSSNLSSG